MASLFIDSTYDITLGILDDEMSWINFQRFVGQKSSSILQAESHNLLQTANLKASELKNIFTVAGPGFYTGLRLSEGVADVFSFIGINHFAFYSYNIPGMVGRLKGVWLTKAYRGEYFFHHWDGKHKENKLISEKELSEYMSELSEEELYIHSETALDAKIKACLGTYTDTHNLLRHYPQAIFSQILMSRSKADSFYFRAPEDEFRVSK